MGKILFGSDSESEPDDKDIKTQNEYAKNYDVWRKKEELNHLKTKYGENILDISESSSSSEDDEDATELTEEVEKDFFKTLSFLKKKDPKIYDNNVTFFNSREEIPKKEKKVKEKSMFLKDYERKLLLENGGVLSDEENDKNIQPPTYTEEQEKTRDELIKVAANIEENNEDEALWEVRKKTKEEKEKEAEYLKWLAGQTEEIQDENIKNDLKPLKEFWNDPNLDSGEKFLRDYVLSKRYLDTENEDYVPTYDEIVHDSEGSLSGDEKELEKQEEFEYKFNFRFEEPDQQFIKRYPRTLEKSLRKTDDRRKLKRAEMKERKKKEKEEKMAEIKKLQELKRKEIEEKIEKLKEVTGATDVVFQDEDIDGDFDPAEHDKRMKQLFSDDFYDGPESDQKPQFPDLDEELEIENWDQWDQEDDNSLHEPHCEDDNFNMDADYDPNQPDLKKELIENTKGRKKRRRKSKVAEALSRPKPKFDPKDKKFEKYLDEYYNLECEDIIGDIPCRFKYREVVPNNFGLTVEEILLAKEKELNRWCSLKKAVQRRPENVEKYDQIAYAKKANNLDLKKRLLPSLFSQEADEDKTVPEPSKNSGSGDSKNEEKQKKSAKSEEHVDASNDNTNSRENISEKDKHGKKQKHKKKLKKTQDTNYKKEDGSSNKKKNEDKKLSFSVNGKMKKKIKKELIVNIESSKKQNKEGVNKNRKRKRVNSESNQNAGRKLKKKSVDVGISDARLTAFGINPKKFKNKLKYGHKSKSEN